MMAVALPDTTSVVERAKAGLDLLRQHVPILLKNPRAYPRDAMILAAALVLMLVLVMLVVFVIIGVIQDIARRRRLRVRVRYDDTARRVGLLLGVVALLVIVLAGATYIPRVDAECGRCHGVSTAVSSWTKDVHGSVACASCHARQGFFGAADWTFARIACTSGHAVPRATVDAAACMRCHDKDIEGVREFAGIKVRHSDPLAAGMLCTDCHAGAGHKLDDAAAIAAANSSTSQSIMNRCVVCHDGQRAPSGCSVCHTSEPNDNPGAPGTVQSTIDAKTTCVGCHTPGVAASCVKCHGLELPHPMPTFLGQHARLSSTDPNLCAKCHETAKGDQPCGCHSGQTSDNNPHGSYSEWFPKHGPVVAANNGMGGCNCHATSFCLMCHTQVIPTKTDNR